jgi:hypothetical protein
MKILLTFKETHVERFLRQCLRQNHKSLSRYYLDFEYFILKKDQKDTFREKIFFDSTLFIMSFNVATERFFIFHVF